MEDTHKMKWVTRGSMVNVSPPKGEDSEAWDTFADEVVKAERKLAKEQADARVTMDVRSHMQACYNVPLQEVK